MIAKNLILCGGPRETRKEFFLKFMDSKWGHTHLLAWLRAENFLERFGELYPVDYPSGKYSDMEFLLLVNTIAMIDQLGIRIGCKQEAKCLLADKHIPFRASVVEINWRRPGTYQQDVLQTFCHCERGMIEAAKAYTANYEV